MILQTWKPGLSAEASIIKTDLTAYKDTPITERVNFQIRFEFFNVFNHVNFNTIQVNQSAGNFGQVTFQELPRNWQVAGKITF